MTHRLRLASFAGLVAVAASSFGVLGSTPAAAERSIPLPTSVLVEFDNHRPTDNPMIDPIDAVVYADGRLVLGKQDYFGTTSQTPGYSVRYLTPTGMAEVQTRLAKFSGADTKATEFKAASGCVSEGSTLVARWTISGKPGSGELAVYSPTTCRNRDAAALERIDAMQSLYEWLQNGALGFSSEPQLYGSRRIMMGTYTSYDQRYYSRSQTKVWPVDVAEPLLDATAAPSVNAWGGRCEIRTTWPGLFIWVLSVFTKTDTGYVTDLGITHPFVRPLLEHEVGCIQEKYVY